MVELRENFLEIVNALAREKSVDHAVVLQALCSGIAKAARTSYGQDQDIVASIDEKTGEISLERKLEVVEKISNSAQILLKDAQNISAGCFIGDIISESLPQIDYSRVASQVARQVVIRDIRDASREKQYELYKDRVGEIVVGVVKRIEFLHSIVVELDNAEGFLRREELLPRENVVVGRRIRSYIYEVERSNKAPQILLSRTRPEFMSLLFHQEVPEIAENVVQIKAIARDPGSRAKIAVSSIDTSIDAVGACVGMRGNRVQAVTGELGGEKIDIIPWSDEVSDFVVHALAPAKISKVLIDHKNRRVIAVSPEDQLSLAIGRRGQNVRLATQLTGWHIDIMTEEQEREKRIKGMKQHMKKVMESLDVEEPLAQMLVTSGFEHVENIAYSPLSAMASLDGFDEDLASELQRRASVFLKKQEKLVMSELQKLKVDPSLRQLDGMTLTCLFLLIKRGVRTIDDIAEYSSEDLVGGWEEKTRKKQRPRKIHGILDGLISKREAREMIIRARAQAGWITEKDKESSLKKIEQEYLDASIKGEI